MTQNINYYHPSVNKFKIKNQYTEIGYDYYNNLSNNPCKCENYTTTTPSIQHYFFDFPY